MSQVSAFHSFLYSCVAFLQFVLETRFEPIVNTLYLNCAYIATLETSFNTSRDSNGPVSELILHMYGPHMHRWTMVMRMLWVTMGMCVCVCVCALLHQV